MIVEIEIKVSENKYGSSLATTELKIDSDSVDSAAVQDLVSGLVSSALNRANKKLKVEVAPPAPTEVNDEPL